MSLTDDPNDNSEAGPTAEPPEAGAQSTVPTIATLRWPIVQVLRDVGRASDAELVELVADSLGLTDQQRAEMIPSGQETRLRNRVSWAAHELKQIGAVYYPKPSFRALTALGNKIDDDQITDLHRAFEAEERRRRKAKKKVGAVVADTQTAWLIRAGGRGEHVESFIESEMAAVGFGQLGDLSEVSSRDEMVELVKEDWPESSDREAGARADQLWAFRSEIRRGDLVVTPRRTNSSFALGRVTGRYWYRHDSDTMRHAVSVNWKPNDVPRTAVRQDLLESLSNPRYRRTINSITNEDEAWRLQQLLETGRDPGPRVDAAADRADLSALVERFRAESGYPTEAHEEQERLRAEWAEKLARERIELLGREDLTAFTNHAVNNGEYVRRVGGVMQWISDLGEPEFDNLLDNIKYLCWGEDELSVRFDQLYVGDRPRKVKGYAGVNISRTLAICHPDSFLPVHRNVGNWGRAKMLSKLGLPAPLGNTPGQRVVDANNRLLEHLEPHFGDDTLAMGAFLGWLLSKELPAKELPDGPMDLTELADELLVEVKFLEDIVSLLMDKGQVILYGPPGTGKTYLARKLAAELAPEESCRALVQFHPSTSYEDFFEGYRPAGTGDDGGIRYELTPGPLARMAERASESSEQHVMIIDEINRGNLPRVLGELLFLLEYRDESVQTLYRPEEPFSLPDNLWFIGTMNTADRSIALVDAALRRRFHFVPFFPDSGPMAGLLGRWLDRQGEPSWVGRLVDAVNDELKAELDGSHLLLGPSHFMKEYGSSLTTQRERLRRIWEYNIEPFIEDQFFGDPEQIKRFRFDAVMRRNGPAAESDVVASDDGDTPEITRGSEGEHAAADGDAAAEPSPTQPENMR